MKTDTQIRSEGMTALIDQLGPAEATRFMTLVQREGFDYNKWRQGLFEGKGVDQIADLSTEKKETGQSVAPVEASCQSVVVP